MSATFLSLGVPSDLVSRLSRLGITEPYPIQSATLADALSGRDICAQSPTGSGKTLSFAIPLVTRVGKGQRRQPRALVLAPARELAAQIATEISGIASSRGKTVAMFYGGTGYGPQINALHRGVDIAVGCPGRLIDLLERNVLDLSGVEIVVIDEADRMADMGFMPAVRRLLDEVKGKRQTMLYSATLSGDVEQLVRRYQDNPARYVLNSEADQMGSRTHTFWRADKEERAATTASLVAEHNSSIVFCRTRRGVDRLTRHLAQAGITAVPIHGDRSQAQRDRALSLFKDGKVQVLVGTDVASRGLHVGGVDCVVHYDPPEDDDTYVHRSGRTGRAGSTGLVVSIISSDQEAAARRLQKRLAITAGFERPSLSPAGSRPASQRPAFERVDLGPSAGPAGREGGRSSVDWHSPSARPSFGGRGDGPGGKPGQPNRGARSGPKPRTGASAASAPGQAWGRKRSGGSRAPFRGSSGSGRSGQAG